MRRDPSLENDQVLRQILFTVPKILGRFNPGFRIAFSPDGRRAVIAGNGTTVVDVASRQVVWKDTDGDSAVFSPEGRRVLTGSKNILRVLDAGSGDEIRRSQYAGTIRAIAFSANGKLLAVATDRELSVGEPLTGTERWSREGTYLYTDISANGELVAATGPSEASIFAAANGTVRRSLPDPRGIRSVTFSPNSRLVAVGSDDRLARVFAVAAGQPEPIRTMNHDGAVVGVSFRPGSQYLLTADATGVIREFIEEHEVARFTQSSQIYTFAMSRDGYRIATVGADRFVRMIDVTGTSRQVSLSDEAILPPRGIGGMALTPDGRRLAISYYNRGLVAVFDVAEAREVWRADNVGSVRSIAIAPDGRTVATNTGIIARADGTRAEFAGDPQSTVGYSAGGRVVITSAGKEFDAATGRLLRHVPGRYRWVEAFSEDGRYAIKREPMKAGEWIAAMPTGSRELPLPRFVVPWKALAVSPDGRYAAVGASRVSVLDRATGREMVAIGKRFHNILALAFSPDGRHLIEASWVHPGYETYVAAYLLRPADLIADACTRVTRNLHPTDEWPKYLQEDYRPTCPVPEAG
jgi:WD40 repeat protein